MILENYILKRRHTHIILRDHMKSATYNLFTSLIITPPNSCVIFKNSRFCHTFAIILINIYICVQYYTVYVDIPAIFHTDIFMQHKFLIARFNFDVLKSRLK